MSIKLVDFQCQRYEAKVYIYAYFKPVVRSQLQKTQLLFPFVDAFRRTSKKKRWMLLLFNDMLISAKYSAV